MDIVWCIATRRIWEKQEIVLHSNKYWYVRNVIGGEKLYILIQVYIYSFKSIQIPP